VPHASGPAASGEPVFFASPEQWRAWLAAHHADSPELLVGFWKVGTGRPSLTWPQSVAEALCFGWIDGVRRSLGAQAYSIRFTPRRPGGIWSAVNVRTYTELLAAGRVEPAGEAAFAARREDRTAVYSFESEERELDAEQTARFRAEPGAWEWFEQQAPSYRRTAIHWVTSAKRPETRERRLTTLVADSAAGRRLRHLDPTRLPGYRGRGSGG
jgi:uncharacterized protein YdeI (YjbR/CyaY-like superfamily)